MKKFLAVYMGSSSGMEAWKAMDETTRRQKEAAGMQGWKNWMAKTAPSLVDGGSPLGKTKRIDGAGVSETRNHIAGYTIVQADSHDAAAELFADHPHFTAFPGDCVEVMECLPIPGM